jgi:hypothetical protein
VSLYTWLLVDRGVEQDAAIVILVGLMVLQPF